MVVNDWGPLLMVAQAPGMAGGVSSLWVSGQEEQHNTIYILILT
jgi:hypothetical protein